MYCQLSLFITVSCLNLLKLRQVYSNISTKVTCDFSSTGWASVESIGSNDSAVGTDGYSIKFRNNGSTFELRFGRTGISYVINSSRMWTK